MRFSRVSLAVLALASLVITASAQAQQDLPSGEAVVQKYVEVTGGKEKYSSIKTQLVKARLKVPDAGVEGDMTLSFKKGVGLLAEIEIENLGETRRGLTGDVGWEKSELQGPRILSEDETAVMKEGADPSLILDQKRFKSVTNEGVEEVKGEKCYKVVSVTKDDREQVDFYSVESGLVVKNITKAPSPFGEMTVNTFVSDYKDVDGIKMPFKTVQELSIGVTQEIVISEVKINVDIPDDKFALPEDVKALQDEK